MVGSQCGPTIPAQFEQIVLPHLSAGTRGPTPKLSLQGIFKLHSATVISGVPMEEAADRKGRRRPS
jgi:hypothetical protein